jgi:hypothetical protein
MIWSGLLMAAVPVRIAWGSYWEVAGYMGCFIVSTTILIGVAHWSALFRQAPRNRLPSLSLWKLFVYALTTCIAVWACYGYMFYPGLISADFHVQWHEMAGRIPYSDWHPVFYGLLVWAVTRLWYSPAAVILAQGLGFALLVGMAATKLERICSPWLVILLMVLFYALFPLFGFYTVSLWKDIVYAILLFWLTLIVLEIVITDGAALVRTGCVI